ncbi:MAG: hypothetical protein S4CHLAM81_04530 [Chlamydiales bacterium]|nr:hypothetical protein [Chlamydiales bacterium]MCH9635242.1 hypothetical protein [Chlamydiales bacterium]
MTILEIVPAQMCEGTGDALIIATMLKNAIKKTRKALFDGDFKKFDANPGDGGCQNRALFFASRDVKPQIFQLYDDRVDRINRVIQMTRQKKGDGMAMLKEQFDLAVSTDVQFCLLSYILTCTKAKKRELPNGIVLTATNIGGLASLCKFDKLRLDRREFVCLMQTKLAKMSNEVCQAAGITLMDPTLSVKLSMVRMGRWEGFPEKPFGFLFYQERTLLGCLHAQKSVICLRNVKPVFTILMKSDGERFEPIEECGADQKLVVFEGATTLSRTELLDRVLTAGFTRAMEFCAANEKQFGPQSAFECDDERVQAVRANPIDLGDFMLDHIYAQTRGRV